jgi:hypothetical protein
MRGGNHRINPRGRSRDRWAIGTHRVLHGTPYYFSHVLQHRADHHVVSTARL